MRNKKKYLLLAVALNLTVFCPKISFGQADFTGLLNQINKENSEGFKVSNFGRFDLFRCNGKKKSNSYIYLVAQKETLKKKFKDTNRWIQFFNDRFVGKKDQEGLDEFVSPLSIFDIGTREVYEVLPYDDKLIFVLIDGRAFDLLTFICNGTGFQKISETVQPDDLDVKPGFPHSHPDEKDNRDDGK